MNGAGTLSLLLELSFDLPRSEGGGAKGDVGDFGALKLLALSELAGKLLPLGGVKPELVFDEGAAGMLVSLFGIATSGIPLEDLLSVPLSLLPNGELLMVGIVASCGGANGLGSLDPKDELPESGAGEPSELLPKVGVPKLGVPNTGGAVGFKPEPAVNVDPIDLGLVGAETSTSKSAPPSIIAWNSGGSSSVPLIAT